MVLQTISAGPKVSRIAAPGVDIRASVPGDTYQCLSGTTMATPHVSGVVALMFAANSGLTADQARHILRHEGSPLEGGDVKRIIEFAKHPPTRQEMLMDSARELLADASQQGLTAQQVLDRRHPIQDEMPLGFRNNSERDRYYQSRVDERAEMADVLRGMEQAPDLRAAGRIGQASSASTSRAWMR